MCKTQRIDTFFTSRQKRKMEGKRHVYDERETNFHEKDTFQERCKKMENDNMQDIKRQEYLRDVYEAKRLRKKMANQEFAQKLLDKQEKEKKVEMQKYLTDAWDGQVEYKRHKKMEMDRIIKQGSDFLMESEQLHRTQDVDKKKQKKEKRQKLGTQDKTEQNTRAQMIRQYELCPSVDDSNEGLQSTSAFVQHADVHKMRRPEKVNSLEQRKKIVYDNLENIKKKEAANFALLEEKRLQERVKQQLDQRFREEEERDKKAILKKSMFDSWDAQIYSNKQEKKKRAEFERQQMAATMELDRLHQIQEIEVRQEKEKEKNLEKSQAEEIEARRQKKDPQQKLKTMDETKKHIDNIVITQKEMHHSVTKQGRDVQYESGFPNCDIPDKDRSHEIRKKLVYNQLSLIKNEEAKKRAFMEDKLLKEMKQRESAEKKRKNLEKETKALAMKSLTDSWDSEIQRKRQEKKKLCEFEKKEMQSLMGLDKVCGGENIQISCQTLPGRSTSKNCARRSVCSADKHDYAKTRPLLSRQKVSNTNPVTLPQLKANTVLFTEDFKQQSKRIRLPFISTPV